MYVTQILDSDDLHGKPATDGNALVCMNFARTPPPKPLAEPGGLHSLPTACPDTLPFGALPINVKQTEPHTPLIGIEQLMLVIMVPCDTVLAFISTCRRFVLFKMRGGCHLSLLVSVPFPEPFPLTWALAVPGPLSLA